MVHPIYIQELFLPFDYLRQLVSTYWNCCEPCSAGMWLYSFRLQVENILSFCFGWQFGHVFVYQQNTASLNICAFMLMNDFVGLLWLLLATNPILGLH